MSKISIVLSGGAAKGGLEVGMLKAILEKYRYDQIEVITGTSVGALNGALVAQQDFDKLIEIWRSIKSWKDIYKNWFFGYVEGFFRGGFVSFSPMKKVIDKYINESIFKSNISYFACDIDLYNRKKNYCGNKNSIEDLDILKQHILASASMVPQFAPINIENRLYSDGGAKEQIPVRKAVEEAKETDIFFILLTKKEIITRNDSNIKSNLYQVLERTIGCLSDEVWNDDITVGKEKYWNDPNKFVIIEPEKSNVTDFKDSINQINIQKDIEQGYYIAKKIMKERNLW